jgi:hypothetical protein
LALEGIDLGMDRELGAVERNFFWLPLGHSEDLALHERSVEHAEEEAANVEYLRTETPPHLRQPPSSKALVHPSAWGISSRTS